MTQLYIQLQRRETSLLYTWTLSNFVTVLQMETFSLFFESYISDVSLSCRLIGLHVYQRTALIFGTNRNLSTLQTVSKTFKYWLSSTTLTHPLSTPRGFKIFRAWHLREVASRKDKVAINNARRRPPRFSTKKNLHQLKNWKDSLMK